MSDLNDLFGHYDCLAAIPTGAIDYTPAMKVTERRWEAAETDRLNEAHWEPVSFDLNQALQSDLPTLRQRSRHEAINNSVIDGAIDTQCTNVVGANGPTLQITTDNNGFNELVEALFKHWAAECEYQDGLSIVDLIEGWIGQWAFDGELLVQEIVGKRTADYKLHDIGGDSIDHSKWGDRIVSGIEVDENERVVAYHVHDPVDQSGKKRLPKEFALHCYRRRFAMQRRGIPALASSLPDIADTRDYDDQVMDAARQAADYAIYMYTDHPDAPFKEPSKDVQAIRRRVRQYCSPGWKPAQLQSHQPAATYESFRKQKHTDIGAAWEMPWMILRRDASNHNMSSARFDGARYTKAIERFQARIERRVLNLVVRRLVRIAQYEGLLPPTPLSKIAKKLQYQFPNCVLPISWTWPKPPPVDQLKDAMAQRIRIENGTLSVSQAITEDGGIPEDVMAARKRYNEDAIASGLPPVLGALPTLPTPELLAVIDPPNGDPANDPPPTDPVATPSK